MTGPTLPYSDEIHQQKYRQINESFREAMNRVASALKDDDTHWKRFREVLLDMRFLPAGRVQSAMGASKSVTPYNCFVSGTIDDSFVDGTESIMQRAHEAAATMRMGGGIGYDFSTLRPRGSMIRKLQSQTSGPISFMSIFDAIGLCVSSSGHRRGAQMGVMRVDHPDIEEFIHAKQNSHRLTGFNISVAVTDKFMKALKDDTDFPLEWEGKVHKELRAKDLWDSIMRSTWDWAEPGVLFIDTINRMNNLYYCETIAATNPCGEQPLPPFGACLLGSFNLVRYLTKTVNGYELDLHQLAEDIPHVVRAMDNVVDRSTYPLRRQEVEAQTKRRMGLGVTGMANAIEATGLLYGTPEFVAVEEEILSLISRETYRASALLAAEKGSFPAYDPKRYGQKGFVSTLDGETLAMIADHGIRNSHLTSIAPTGTISLAADNVSSGIEPVFAHEFQRTINDFNGQRIETVTDYAVRELGVKGKKAADVTIDEHLDVLIAAQRHVDSAVSKTCNVSDNVSWEAFKQVYIKAWEGGCKGCTTYRASGKRAGILVEEPAAEGSSCEIDPETGRRSCE